MTKEQLKSCFAIRQEIIIVERQLAACGEESYQIPKLKARWEKLAAELDAVEDYIDSLDDSIMRQIVTLHFVEGMTIKETAGYIGYSEKHTNRLILDLFLALE